MGRYIGFIFALAVFAFLAIAFWTVNENLPKPKKITFTQDYYKTLSESKTDQKPIILIFTASWCGPCQYMKKQVYPSAEVSSLADRFHWLMLDVDDSSNQGLAQKYGVRGIPHIQVIDKFEKRKGLIVGGRSPSDFAAFLQKQQ